MPNNRSLVVIIAVFLFLFCINNGMIMEQIVHILVDINKNEEAKK